MTKINTRFLYYSWFILAYTVLVIMWGAYVRATGSGAGCGQHWPTCNGQVIPRPEQIETWIELSHRLTSAMLGFFSIGQVAWAFRAYPVAHRVRKAAVASFGLTVFEGALGAGLVLFELVAGDTSTTRAVVVGFHLVNTMLLVGAFTLVVWWAAGGSPLRLGGDNRPSRHLLGVALVAMLILSAFGAITALGDTLFPVESLSEGLAQKFDPSPFCGAAPHLASLVGHFDQWLYFGADLQHGSMAQHAPEKAAGHGRGRHHRHPSAGRLPKCVAPRPCVDPNVPPDGLQCVMDCAFAVELCYFGSGTRLMTNVWVEQEGLDWDN
ncbi:MAG: COX15/CtaA family protein [Chloroflexi bacterium]|nr:COX15/CtaA family protein [Chloroflexota bacterium]